MALATVAIVGFGLIVCGVSINACLQVWVPDHLRGRVMALFSLIFVSLQPLGGFLAGLTAELIGTGSALRIAAAMCLLSAAALYLWSQHERHAAADARGELALEAA
jgi:hypothetical protein